MKLNPIAILLVGLATAGAFLLTSGSSTHAYEDQLLAVAVHQSFGNLAPKITQESPEIQALLLDYADNEPLLLQTRLALLGYPDLAHRILPTYGDEPEFHEVLLIYGGAALPPIAYFMNHDRHVDGRCTAAWLRCRGEVPAHQYAGGKNCSAYPQSLSGTRLCSRIEVRTG